MVLLSHVLTLQQKLKLINKLSHKGQILDFGCGTGAISGAFLARYDLGQASVVLVDQKPAFLETAKATLSAQTTDLPALRRLPPQHAARAQGRHRQLPDAVPRPDCRRPVPGAGGRAHQRLDPATGAPRRH